MSGKPQPSSGRSNALGKLRCRTVATGGFKNLDYVRDLAPMPVEERLGPPHRAPVATPFETLLAALGSCLASRIHANAASANVVVHRLGIELRADVVTTSMWRVVINMPGPPGLDTICIKVHLHANATPDELKALIADSLMLSPVANTLHGPVDLDVALAEMSLPGA